MSLQATGDAVWRDRSSHLVVCNPTVSRSSITIMYSGGLAPFFTDESLHKAFEPGNFLNKVSTPFPSLYPWWMAAASLLNTVA